MMINEDYFIKYLKNELTEEETRQLIAWVKEKKENQDFLFSLKDSYVYLNYENDCKEADTEHEWQKFAQRTGLSVRCGTPAGFLGQERHRSLLQSGLPGAGRHLPRLRPLPPPARRRSAAAVGTSFISGLTDAA